MRLLALLTVSILATTGPAVALPVGPSDVPDLHEPIVVPSCGRVDEWTEYGAQSPSPLPDDEWKRVNVTVHPEGCADVACDAATGQSCCDLTGVTCTGLGVSCSDPSDPVCAVLEEVWNILWDILGHRQQGFSVPGTAYGACVTYTLDDPQDVDAQAHNCV